MVAKLIIPPNAGFHRVSFKILRILELGLAAGDIEVRVMVRLVNVNFTYVMLFTVARLPVQGSITIFYSY